MPLRAEIEKYFKTLMFFRLTKTRFLYILCSGVCCGLFEMVDRMVDYKMAVLAVSSIFLHGLCVWGGVFNKNATKKRGVVLPFPPVLAVKKGGAIILVFDCAGW